MGRALKTLIAPLASLRLTVVLFALSIFLVFTGTLAQVDHGIWYVVNHSYFRVWVAQIDLQVFERLVQMFTPVQWQLSGKIPFPGGLSIGALLMANLLSAHAIRFKVATSGRRLWAGLVVIGLGLLTTYAVIQSGRNEVFESELSPAFCNGLWHALRATLAGVALAGAYVLVQKQKQEPKKPRRTVEWYLLLAIVLPLAGLAIWLFLNPEARLDDSGLRILWQLFQGTAAGLVLLVGCVLVFKKRAGIVLLHGGVALMMFSELLTGLTANEAQMQITEGQATRFARDIRTTELAIIRHEEDEQDRVTVVPESLLVDNARADTRIDHADLPFSIKVLEWLPNSRLRSPAKEDSNRATAGYGEMRIAELLATGAGIDGDAGVDSPSAYVELFSKTSGQSLGVYLVSQWLLEQPIEVDGQKMKIDLRFKRIYKPYTLTLKDFRFDRYVGSSMAKNYSSLIRLEDPERNVDREILIWMNNPLRYAGTTYYQADFDKETEKTSILQVVTNPGWMIPYVACMLVATGMLAHFGVVLLRFLNGAGRFTASEEDAEGLWQPIGSRRFEFAKWFPAIVLLLFVGYLSGKARMPRLEPTEMQVFEFAKLPVASHGRIKPYDTLARNSLQRLSGRQEVITSTAGKKKKTPAIRWLLDVISDSPQADVHPVFRITHLELQQTLGLKPRPGSFRYSIDEIRGELEALDKQIQLAVAAPESTRSLYQKSVLRLAEKLNFYAMLQQSFRPPRLRADREHFAQDMQGVQQIIRRLRASSAPHAVPPAKADGHWLPLMEAELMLLRDQVMKQPVNQATVGLRALLAAYAEGNAKIFNKQLAEYRKELAQYENRLEENRDEVQAAGMASSEVLSLRKVNFETFFNQFSPFYYAAVLYVAAFLLATMSWLGWREPLQRSATWLLLFTFAVHTLALLARIYISGRPPVTNLYSSAVFIGWACVLFALVFESIYRLGLGNIVASVIGFLTLLVAHFLSLDGDTFTVLQAVLDTQFWLATHVVCITLGYSTTLLAGMLGILSILLAHVFPVLDKESSRQLTRMTYGTLCFAIFFSFVGTVLGGLWADDSWGRFWGWDPKENGALIIVLYSALVLHARWGGLVKGRGLACLAIGGNIVTCWSWFGVNELGVGLHAYGANSSSTAMWLLLFATTQLAIILLGVKPQVWFAGKDLG